MKSNENLENRVGELTLALSDRGIKANVLVKDEGSIGKKKKQLFIVVNDLPEPDGKKNCAIINEVVLDRIGYGTCSSNYQNRTLEVKYSPLREEKSVSDKDYHTTPGTN